MSPGVTIIVCTYNGKSKIGPTLTHISQLEVDFKSGVELIIVDNNSNDGTADWCSQWLKFNQFPFAWKVIVEKKPGLSFARWTGILSAEFDYILFCDDDNYLQKDYLKIGFRVFEENPKIGVIGGHGIPIFEHERPDWYDTYGHSFAVGDQFHTTSSYPAKIYGAGAFFRKKPLHDGFQKGFISLLDDRKGDSLSSCGDSELCMLVQLAGYSVHYCAEMKFQHYMPVGRLTWEYYLKLKSGISEGYGVMFLYEAILANPKRLNLDYKVYLSYILAVIELAIANLKFKVKSFFKLYDKQSEQIGKMTIPVKLRSLYSNFKNLPFQIRHIKSLANTSD